MRRHSLDGRTIKSSADFYDQLTHALALPEQFGRNLDALWDTLTTDIEGPVKLTWRHAKVSRAAMPAEFDELANVLKDVMTERDDFKVEFK
jgi:ribonuclease inhibitor